MSYNNIKNHKNQGVIPSLKNTVLEKPKAGESNLPPGFLGINTLIVYFTLIRCYFVTGK